MGRKTRKRVISRPKPTLPTMFQCPHCARTDTLQITIKRNPKNKHDNQAEISCTCEAFPADGQVVILKDIKSIDEKVDVYGKFIDMLNTLSDTKNWITALNLETKKPKTRRSRQLKIIPSEGGVEAETGAVEETILPQESKERVIPTKVRADDVDNETVDEGEDDRLSSYLDDKDEKKTDEDEEHLSSYLDDEDNKEKQENKNQPKDKGKAETKAEDNDEDTDKTVDEDEDDIDDDYDDNDDQN